MNVFDTQSLSQYRHLKRLSQTLFVIAALFWNPVSGQIGLNGTARMLEAADPASRPLALPLVAANGKPKLLAICQENEARFVRSTCQQLRIPLDVVEDFGDAPADFKNYHALLIGSNRMDYFDSPERKNPAVFDPVVDFVSGGGHLIVFGTYHGRNMEHLQRFGIRAEGGGDNTFARLPLTTEVLFAGSESILPKDDRTTFMGKFQIDRPHVVMLGRPRGVEGISTLALGEGRVTIMMVEPYAKNDYWLITAILRWHLRGAPTRALDSGLFGIASPLVNNSKTAVLTDKELAEQGELIRSHYDAEFRQLKVWNPTIAKELSRELLHQPTAGVNRYAALVESRELAVRAGDAATIINTVEASAQDYEIDPLAVLLDSLNRSAPACKSNSECWTLAEVSTMGAYEAEAAGKLDLAEKFLDLARKNAKRARANDLVKQIATLSLKMEKKKKQ